MENKSFEDTEKTVESNHDFPCSNKTVQDNDDSISVATELTLNPVPGDISVCGLKLPLQLFNSFLAALTVISNVGLGVMLPVYTKKVDDKVKSPFIVLVFSGFWFPIVFFGIALTQKLTVQKEMSLVPWKIKKYVFFAGTMNAINAILMVYTADPSRTPAYLQAILLTFTIPFTVACRYIMLRKGVSIRRGVCTGIVIIGLFITLEPQIWNLDGSSSSEAENNPVFLRILYPMLFAISQLPVGIVTVIWEKEMKEDDSSSIGEFGRDLANGFKCHFGADPTCSEVPLRCWLFIFSYLAANLFSLLLVKYAEGAIYMMVVRALVTPLGTLFWSVFAAEPNFHWMPTFTITTGFTLAGLAIMTPAIVMYNMFSVEDMEAEYRKSIKEEQLIN